MFERLWSWLTARLLGGECYAVCNNHVVVDVTQADAEEIADTLNLPAFKDPVESFHDLPDERGRIYVWKAKTEQGRTQLLRGFDHSSVEPEALHFVVTELEDLREIDEQELKPYLGGLN